MAEYNTEQKRSLIAFLKANSENSYTIEEIIEGLKLQGAQAVGKSTVYRLMTRLVDDGVVHRSAGARGRQFVYRIIADDHCKNHLHLQCMSCGKILHLDESVSDSLLKSVNTAENFSVSEEDTVLMGRCADCKQSHSGGKHGH